MKEKYYILYEQNKDLFEKYFKEDAEDYWNIYVCHYFNNVPYFELEKNFSRTESTLKRIVKKLKHFLTILNLCL